jgi:hypothetical protein
MLRKFIIDALLLAAVLGLLVYVIKTAPVDPGHHYDDRD